MIHHLHDLGFLLLPILILINLGQLNPEQKNKEYLQHANFDPEGC